MAPQTWCSALLLLLAGWAYAQGAGGQGPGVRDQEPGVRGQRSNQPLHQRIDQLVEAAAIGPLAPVCSDADFVRRVYLDLTGVIPTAEQARTFLADSSADKRQRLIDELLASPAFVRHLTLTLDVMLIERRADKTTLAKPWLAYLYESVAVDKPLDQLFRELIAADGGEGDKLAVARFFLNRDAEPNLVTRDIGRLAFGLDLQCCQCHDHPLIDDYYQEDYYGLFAFVHRTSLFTDPKSKLVLLTEKADGDVSFKSVFTGDGKDKAQPRLPKGAVLFVEPTFGKGEEYSVKPDKTVRGVPKFSRRQALAELLPESSEFRRNMANRVWAMLLSRGIVHPVDSHYAANPPANPPLLSLLSEELKAGGFKLRPLFREIALTRTYQRSCDAPRPEIVNFADIAARLERLQRDKEKLTAAVLPLQDAVTKAKTDFKAARDEDTRLAGELPKLEKAVADANQAADKAIVALKMSQESAAKLREQASAVAELVAKTTEIEGKLPNDPALEQAIAAIGKSSVELAAAADSAAKQVAVRTSEQSETGQRLAAAELALKAAGQKRLTPERLRGFEQTQLETEHQFAEAKYGIAAMDMLAANAKAILDYRVLAQSDPEKAAAAWSAVVERLTIAGQVAPLKALSPEQMAASAMRATGMFTSQEASAVATINNKPPDELKNATDADKPRMKARFVELRLLDQIDGTINEFVKYYGGQPGQDFQATVNQALFFGNGTTIDGWLKPAGENLVARLSKLDDSGATADEMYQSIFSRPPSEAEKQNVAAYLKDRSDKPIALAEMAWALLSSSEFRFNH
jgi:hypothetical protein